MLVGSHFELTEEQRSVIRASAESDLYRENPLPDNIRAELNGNLLSFVNIPPMARANLAAIYDTDDESALAMVQADWAESLACGAVRLYATDCVDFSLHEATVTGFAVEACIKRSNPGQWLPWYLSYVPTPTLVRLARDVQAQAQEQEQTQTQTATPAHAELPPLRKQEIEGMLRTADYVDGPVPADVLAQVEGYEGAFSSWAWVSGRWREDLEARAGTGTDVVALLDRDWAFATSIGALRFYEDKLLFPISIMRADRCTPVEVAIKPDARSEGEQDGDMLPWFVSFVNDFVPSRRPAAKALTDWAHMGNWSDVLAELADMALPERWDFEESADDAPRYSILKKYLIYTFYRLQSQGGVLEDARAGLAAFNTGLVERTYEPLYACFTPAAGTQQWRFEAFCKAGSRPWGKKLVATFNPLPPRAQYFNRKEDLLFDTARPLEIDVDHILLDNIDRLPREFLEEELRGDADALDLVAQAFDAEETDAREEAFDALRDAVEDNYKIRRRLKNRLDDAIDLAKKRVEWNFRTAVPAFYPTRNAMALLLPLDLTEDEKPDLALVVELTSSGAYIGQTILTMPMAYNNARLLCRPDSDWLNTSLKMGIDLDE